MPKDLVCSETKRVWIEGKDQVAQSLFYCDRHTFLEGEELPSRPAYHQFFTATMQKKWLYHFAEKFEHRLKSCRELTSKYRRVCYSSHFLLCSARELLLLCCYVYLVTNSRRCGHLCCRRKPKPAV
jgi:hypothetical protein